jgi:plasmid stability protein
MANLHIRDVDEMLVRKLHQRAKANGRSAAEEHRQILRDALLGGNPADIHAIAARLRELTRGRPKDRPAEELIREQRDSR